MFNKVRVQSDRESDRRWQKYYDDAHADAQGIINTKKRININLKWVKPVSITILYILAGVTVLAIIWLIYKLVIVFMVIKHVTYMKFFLYFLGWAAGAIAVAFLLFLLIKSMSNISISCKNRKLLASPFVLSRSAFITVIHAIGSFLFL